ncbi:unnamed protein product [Periconia digitata]|uniref:Uncharacterized protein n=1 Tax=Periconia digitata TaxID=1303443 RepID=A0A9W4U278_9PLEO|nr:unnamed protein product [Periconia digitata]
MRINPWRQYPPFKSTSYITLPNLTQERIFGFFSARSGQEWVGHLLSWWWRHEVPSPTAVSHGDSSYSWSTRISSCHIARTSRDNTMLGCPRQKTIEPNLHQSFLRR